MENKKIFIPFKDIEVSEDGWVDYSSKNINFSNILEIQHEGEASAAIPSPFAYMALIDAAFRWITKQMQDNKNKDNINDVLEGNTTYHKLISYTLDVAELFFYYDLFRDNLKILVWDINKGFDELYKFKKLGELLEIYLKNDYKYKKEGKEEITVKDYLEKIYFLVDRKGESVIGATSFLTLFAPAPDASEIAKKLNIKFGRRQLLSDTYVPLHKRSDNFILYLYSLRAKYDIFNSVILKNFLNFLEIYREIGLFNINLQDAINKIVKKEGKYKDYVENYAECQIDGEEICNFMGITLRIHRKNPKEIEKVSSFVIKSDFSPENIEFKPLVLPNKDKLKYRGWLYVDNEWNSEINIPDKNTSEPKKSILPGNMGRYYWLSEGNFLSDKIFRLPYIIDSKWFYTGADKTSFLLPLTDIFFQYFNVDKVKYFQIVNDNLAGGGVEVKLKIPVKGPDDQQNYFVEFVKVYHKQDIIDIKKLYLAIMPYFIVKTSLKLKFPYYIGIIADKNNISEINFTIITKEDNKDKIAEIKLNNSISRYNRRNIESRYYKTEHEILAIKVLKGNDYAYIKPNMTEVGGNSELIFSVDFGTTNTHISYIYSSDKLPKSFTNTSDKPIWQSLLNREFSDKILLSDEAIFETEMLPYLIGENAEVRFPLRTGLLFNKDIKFDTIPELIRQANSYLLFETKPLPFKEVYAYKTELKWGNYNENKEKNLIASFIQYVLKLIYYKNLLLDSSPEKAKIIYYYPISMNILERSIYKKLWEDAYKAIFGKEEVRDNLINMPESLPPYFHHDTIDKNSLFIDIGGGTTDIAYFMVESGIKPPDFITSIKFAANSIWGFGYPKDRTNIKVNENLYVDRIDKIIKEISNDEERQYFEGLKQDNSISDYFNYFFAILRYKPEYKLEEKLAEDDSFVELRTAIFFFYGSLAYYSAKLFKGLGYDIPQVIFLSGNGAKTSFILDVTNDLMFLNRLFKFFFEKVCNISIDDLTIEINREKAKQITSEGGLIGYTNEHIGEILKKDKGNVAVWLGGNTVENKNLERFYKVNKFKYEDLDNKQLHPTYKEALANNEALNSIATSILEFFDLLIDFLKTYEWNTIDANYLKDLLKDITRKKIVNLLIGGLNAFYIDEDSIVTDTLFFYPLIGILKKMAIQKVR